MYIVPSFDDIVKNFNVPLGEHYVVIEGVNLPDHSFTSAVFARYRTSVPVTSKVLHEVNDEVILYNVADVSGEQPVPDNTGLSNLCWGTVGHESGEELHKQHCEEDKEEDKLKDKPQYIKKGREDPKEKADADKEAESDHTFGIANVI